LDFRKQVLKTFHNKLTKLGSKNKGSFSRSVNYTTKLYNIARTTLFNWIKRNNQNNLDNNNKNSGNKFKINRDKIDLLNNDNIENYTLKEIANILSVSKSTVHYYFIKNNITFKKKSYGITRVMKNK